ncbi:MAG TPA: response regulator transcription factor [bacterium]|nr:response regulator transcription factor [bacterium]
MGQPYILVVEDDPAVARITRDLFLKEGYTVTTVAKGADALKAVAGEEFDLLVLDLELPDMDGLEICEAVQKGPPARKMPVFILTARGSSEDIVKGLEAGAEDYLPKPFNEREFLARARAILRRKQPLTPKDDRILSGTIALSPSSHEAWCADKAVSLTLREFDILHVFLSSVGQALTREEIIKRAWGPATAIVPKVVDVHLGHLRSKLGAEGKRIETVPQVGYKLAPPKT